jgi:hypothetical protein
VEPAKTPNSIGGVNRAVAVVANDAQARLRMVLAVHYLAWFQNQNPVPRKA